MTPEREREIRRIAGRDGQTWRSSAVSLVALNEVLDELDRLRGAADALETTLVECRELAQQRVDKLFREEGTEWMAHEDKGRRQGYNGAIILGRELGLWS